MKSSGREYIRFASESLLKYLDAMKAESEGVKSSEDPEFIHRMRVAARRMRTALSVFEDCFPSRKSEKFIKKIRRFAGVLGDARDADVRMIFLKEYLQTLPEKKYVDGIKRLLLRTEQARKKLQPLIVRVVDESGHNGLFEDMEKAFRNPEHKGKRENPIRRRFLEETIWRLEEITGYEEAVRLPENIDELHDMRIAVKHLRYCLEIFDSAIEGLGKHIKNARHMQEILGDIHDCDVWIDYLPSFIEDEERRAVDYCGSTAPVARLKPGIIYLFEDRKAFRQKRYEEFIALWDSSSGLRSELYSMLDK
jgi:CHAD domain-containing protein